MNYKGNTSLYRIYCLSGVANVKGNHNNCEKKSFNLVTNCNRLINFFLFFITNCYKICIRMNVGAN